jgi:hypothetical protein
LSPDYRLYLLDGCGRICSVVELQCVDDAAAVALVERRGDSAAKELWNLARVVKRWVRSPS